MGTGDEVIEEIKEIFGWEKGGEDGEDGEDDDWVGFVEERNGDGDDFIGVFEVE